VERGVTGRVEVAFANAGANDDQIDAAAHALQSENKGAPFRGHCLAR
jgi:hypothetical protein